MKTELRVVKTLYYVSESDPNIETTNAGTAKLIDWADEHPEVYRLVQGTKSRVYGREATDYHGWARGPNATSAAILHRIEVFLDDLQNTVSNRLPALTSFWKERAEFSLEHQDDSGFTGAVFQQYAIWTDGKEYPRACIPLDYTPKTLEMIVDRFAAWMDPDVGPTTRITADSETVRVCAGAGAVVIADEAHVNASSQRGAPIASARTLPSGPRKKKKVANLHRA